jgi:uncharacterized damage-inducible protein DinB
MSFAENMIMELVGESATTQKMLERVPDDKLAWKPHEKSMSMSRLATHVAEMLSWVSLIISSDELDLAQGDHKPHELGSRKELLDRFHAVVEDTKKVLAGKTDQELMLPWKLKMGSQVLVELPRSAAIRSLVMNHFIHHRGQLSVYLRLNDIPVPGAYGPSADES